MSNPNPRTAFVHQTLYLLQELKRGTMARFLGLTAQHTDGLYAGRWGMVTAVRLDDVQGITCLVQPYRAEVCGPDGKPNQPVEPDKDLLWDHPAARIYRPVDSYAWADEYEPCQKCNRRVQMPCHTAESFHQDGPWDSACQDFFSGARRPQS